MSRRDTGPTKAIRELVLDRDDRSCFRCGIPVAWFGSYSIHHRSPRGAGGTSNPKKNLPGNLLTLCGTATTGCHQWVESHRTEASRLGLLLSIHVADPEEWPVHGWHDEPGKAYLSNEGTLTLVADGEES